MKKRKKEFKAWEKEKKLIPEMIKKYCRGKHGTGRKDGLCEECKALADYALYRLDRCPFKADKKFCSFCEILCYRTEMRAKIKEVMRYSGPRMLATHPIFALSHVVQAVRYKKSRKKEAKEK